MHDIYMPNMFRRENFRKTIDNQFSTNIPYFLDFDMDNPLHFETLIQVEISKILENIMLFERVFVDLLDFPIIVKKMLELDVKATYDILRKGYLSFINNDLIVITITERNGAFYIASAISNKGKITTVEDLIKYGFNDISDGKLINSLKQNLKYSKSLDCNLIELGKNIVHQVDKELENRIYKKIGIGVNGNYVITNKNKGIYDAICQVTRDDTIATLLDIETIYYDEVLEEIYKARRHKINYSSEFDNLIQFNDIPDLKVLFLQGKLNLSDIINLKKKKAYKDFYNWFHENKVNSSNNLVKLFHKELLKTSLIDKLPMKTVRFIVTSLLGCIPYVGTAAGVVDTFLLDKIGSKKPNVLINDIKKTINDKPQYLLEIAVPVREVINIDLSDERTIDELMNKQYEILEFCRQLLEHSHVTKEKYHNYKKQFIKEPNLILFQSLLTLLLLYYFTGSISELEESNEMDYFLDLTFSNMDVEIELNHFLIAVSYVSNVNGNTPLLKKLKDKKNITINLKETNLLQVIKANKDNHYLIELYASILYQKLKNNINNDCLAEFTELARSNISNIFINNLYGKILIFKSSKCNSLLEIEKLLYLSKDYYESNNLSFITQNTYSSIIVNSLSFSSDKNFIEQQMLILGNLMENYPENNNLLINLYTAKTNLILQNTSFIQSSNYFYEIEGMFSKHKDLPFLDLYSRALLFYQRIVNQSKIESKDSLLKACHLKIKSLLTDNPNIKIVQDCYIDSLIDLFNNATSFANRIIYYSDILNYVHTNNLNGRQRFTCDLMLMCSELSKGSENPLNEINKIIETTIKYIGHLVIKDYFNNILVYGNDQEKIISNIIVNTLQE